MYDVIGDPFVLGKDQATLTVSLSIDVVTLVGTNGIQEDRIEATSENSL